MLLPLSSCLLLLAAGVARAHETTTSATLIPRRVLQEHEFGHKVTRLLSSYEVHDFSLHEGHRRMLTQVGEANIVYPMHVLGRRITLDLTRNDKLFAAGYKHQVFGANGEVVQVHGPPDCHYLATVREDPGAIGAFTLCDGIMHATVHSQDKANSFSVQPVELIAGAEHVVYNLNDIIPRHHTCGVEDDVGPQHHLVTESHDHHHEEDDHHHDESTTTTTTTSSSSSSSSSSPPDHAHRTLSANNLLKTVGVLIVNDQKRFSEYGAATHNHAAQLAQVANALYGKLGVDIDSTYKVQLELIGMYTFSIQDPWYNTPGLYDSSGNVFAGSNTQPGLLNAFNSWRAANALPNDPINGHDVGHLLCGTKFQGSTIGLASLHAACEPSLKSAITQAVQLADAQISSTMTHEIGHNLGMSHTNVVAPSPVGAECDCPDSSGNNPCNPKNVDYIMDAASAGTAHVDWSACSTTWLHDQLVPGSQYYNTAAYPPCLEAPVGTAAAPYWSGGTPVCGDGLRQGDEECDCPLGNCAGLDPCCDGATCKLLPGRKCSAQDPCCDTSALACTITVDQTKVCRPAAYADGCDYVEKCDGVLASCPADTFASTGQTCTTVAYKAAGICYDKKCHSLIDQCKTVGASEAQPTDYLAPCIGHGTTGGDATCGNIYCSTYADGSLTSCYVISVPVEQGSQCDTSSACYVGKCVEYSMIPVPGNLNCSNGIEDQDETDVDCGGTQCWGCDTGMTCKTDRDCIYPAHCNMTAPVTGRNGTYGHCGKPATSQVASSVCFGNPTCLALYDSAWGFISANPWVWAIIGVLILMCLYSCCVPRHNHEGKKVTLAHKGLAQAQTSFRDLRTNGSFRRPNPGQQWQPKPVDDIPVAIPVNRAPMLQEQKR